VQRPDRFLVLAGQGLDRQPGVTDRGQRSVLVAVGAKHIGQQRGIAGVGLLARG